MISITAKDLEIKYERQVALSISELSISGTILAVLGHNGAGKSTLLKTLLGLLRPQHGTLYASNSSGERLIPELHMAFCPENGAVFEDIRVADYLRIWLRLRAKNDSLKSERVEKLLSIFEVDPLLKKYGRELSKGQRRRVQSVVGFLIEPTLFLFDEPFDGLDVQKTAELAEILENYKEKTAFIVSSHRMDVIERVADSGIVLANGKVVAQGDISSLSSQLGGKSIAIRKDLFTSNNDLKEIAEKFLLYLTHIGEHVVLTGPRLEDLALREFIISKGIANIDEDLFIPTLTDAMGYHLHSIKSSNTKTKI